MANEHLVKIFNQLVLYYKNKNSFISNAYKKVITVLKDLPEIHDTNDLKGVKGIGPGIISKIKEILETGTLSILAISPEEQEKNRIIEELCTVRSIGPVSAEKMYNNGVRSINDLKNLNLNHQQRLGLLYHEDLNKRIPRADITAFHDYIKTIVPDSWKTTIVGSYRRKFETSGDIDLLISTDNDSKVPVDITPLINKLTKNNCLIGIYGQTLKFMSGLINWRGVVRSLDIKSYTKEEKPFAILYFTGSGPFNVNMRKYAISKGYKLSDTCLIDLSTELKVKCTTEKSIFKILGLDYVEPENRI